MANSTEIYDKYFWFVNGNRLGIIEKNHNSDINEEYTSPSTTGSKIRIEYISRAVAFDTDLSKESELPDQFHEALVYKVIAELYRLPGESFNLQLSEYYEAL